MAHRPRIGELLLQRGVLTLPQLEGALTHHHQWGVTLGRSAVLRGLCSEAQVLEALAMQLDLPTVDLDAEAIAPEVSGLIPQRIAEQHRAVALRLTGAKHETLVVAMGAPADLDAQDAVRAVSQHARLQVLLAGDEAIWRAISRVYRGDRVLGSSATAMRAEHAPAPLHLEALGLSATARARLERVAQSQDITPTELVRRVLEHWALSGSA